MEEGGKRLVVSFLISLNFFPRSILQSSSLLCAPLAPSLHPLLPSPAHRPTPAHLPLDISNRGVTNFSTNFSRSNFHSLKVSEVPVRTEFFRSSRPGPPVGPRRQYPLLLRLLTLVLNDPYPSLPPAEPPHTNSIGGYCIRLRATATPRPTTVRYH